LNEPTLDPLSILIVKTSALGDVLIALSLLDHIKQLAPNAAVDWAVEQESRDVVGNHPFVREAITICSRSWRKCPFKKRTRQEVKESIRRLRKKRYDIVFDIQGNIKSGLITFLAKSSKKIGYASDYVPEWPNLLVTSDKVSPSTKNQLSDYLELVYKAFDTPLPDELTTTKVDYPKQTLSNIPFISDKKDKVVLVCPQSRWNNKRLKRRTMTSFLQKVQAASGCKLLFAWGSDIERCNAQKMHSDLGDSSAVLPRLAPLDLFSAIEACDLVISVDSFSLHLAAKTSTPTFSIYGASLGKYYAPRGPEHAFFQGSCPYHLNFNRRCPLLRTCKTGACIKRIDADHLFSVFSKTHLFKDLIKNPTALQHSES
jgi:heptosyltransferase I